MLVRTANNSEERDIMTTLFTGVSSSLISQHVVNDRLDMEKVDTTKRQELQFEDGALVKLWGSSHYPSGWELVEIQSLRGGRRHRK